DRARRARRELLDELHADGVALEQLEEAVRQQRLALLPVERVLGGEGRYSARELAQRTGLDLETLHATRRALGLAVPDPDERVYGEDDLEAARIQVRVRDAGFQREHLLETNRVLGRGIARYVEALRTTIAEALLEPEADERELGRRFATVAAELVPLNAPWMEYVFELHLRQMLRNEAVTLQARASGRGESRTAAVGFADLVGFTELGQTVDVEELSDVAGTLQRMTGELVDPPVRLVKVIGDAVMLVSPSPRELVETAIELVERAEATDGFPPLRAGVAYGPAANHFGDWFGSTVNLASRLTARARPGSVLVTEEVRENVDGDGLDWSPAGPKRLKGFSSPVTTYRVRRAGAAPPRKAPQPAE
ncbi:MAG: adenylate cyclase regulatory domain-containing protein, partial [Solirubrobacteraceae bacterium]